ncbi:MAG: hypothetical protein KGZ39_07830 [Simkania sp.]|nr:hypothetical protein [Simkania sp.]
MNYDPFSRRIPQLFWKCITLSLMVHFLFIAALYWHPLWITRWFALFPHPFKHSTVAYQISKDPDLLEDAFDKLIVVSRPRHLLYDAPHPYAETVLPLLENPLIRLEKPPIVLTPFSPYLTQQIEGALLQTPLLDIPLFKSSIEPSHPLLCFDDNDKNLSIIDLPFLVEAIPDIQTDDHKTHTPQEQSFSSFLSHTLQEQPHVPLNATEELYTAPIIPVPKPLKQPILGTIHSPSTQIVLNQQTPAPPQSYGLPKWDAWQDWQHLFHVDVQVMPRKEQEGIFFAITLIPKPEATLKAMKQHFHFIIDCSQNTEKHRISVYKKAIERSLGYLQDGHTFNIYFADKHIHALSTTPVIASRKTITQAKLFLEKQTSKGTGTKETLLSLFKDIALKSKEHASIGELDSVILLTDGVVLQDSNKRSPSFKEWLKEGSPPFVLYATSIGNDTYPAILDALTMASGGKVLHSSTHAAFPRKFAKLVLDLKTPIATNVRPSLDIEDTSSSISLMRTCCKMAPLFASQPTTFFGAADKVEDFILHLEGIAKDSPMEMSLDINLKSCRQGTLSFRQIALQDNAEHELSLYLQNGKEVHLDQALEKLETSIELRKYR